MTAVGLGVAACALIVVGSYGAGATRNRGGLMREIGLDTLLTGHGRSIMDAILTAGIVGLIVAWVWLGHAMSHRRAGPREVYRAAASWAGALLLSAPILSRDVYSYLMQGAMRRDGFDPYTEGAAVNPGPYLFEVSHDWRNTTTPYGPLHLWIGDAVTSLVGDHVSAGLVAYKLLTAAGFAGIAWAVPRIAQLVGGNPALAVWLGVANPVMLLHLIGGMHNEAVMVGLVSVGLFLVLRERPAAGTALIALAVSLKATAAIALPFVVWIAFHQFRRPGASRARQVALFGAVGACAVAMTLAVLAAVTYASGSSWGWVAEITGNSKVVNPLAGPTLVADAYTPLAQLFDEHFYYNTALTTARRVGSVVMLAGLVLVWVYFSRGRRQAVTGIACAYAVAFVANAVTFPWYYASLLSLVGAVPTPLWVRRAVVFFSVLVAGAFTGSGNHRFYEEWFLFAGVIVAWVAAEWVYPRAAAEDMPAGGARTPSPERA
ncbi:alpha-(1-_6)-mannopyranosyltransferase A [Corynebacterium liangguodongii]|uniref:Alpha-(1->6)-mannopyranosyltransferase A n=1 Tax=Corynebacterium liangguodongii TaxID=2079535 RepID=A0A2S0WH61_9CORY|nr:alpha-(1->6)-mannopyranosyltransferase A [Corynebacterium liangguodongii]PWB99959.1 alpha-(1->6)-mannopyranosyltransferase A [Corynebacterium liangguodongii]